MAGGPSAAIVVPASDESDAEEEEEEEEKDQQDADEMQQGELSDAGSAESELDFRIFRRVAALNASGPSAFQPSAPTRITDESESEDEQHSDFDPVEFLSQTINVNGNARLLSARSQPSRSRAAASSVTALPTVEATPSPEPEVNGRHESADAGTAVMFDLPVFDQTRSKTLELSPEPEGSVPDAEPPVELAGTQDGSGPSSSRPLQAETNSLKEAGSRSGTKRQAAKSSTRFSTAAGRTPSAQHSTSGPPRKKRKCSPVLIRPMGPAPPVLDPSAEHITRSWAARGPTLSHFWSSFTFDEDDEVRSSCDRWDGIKHDADTYIKLDILAAQGLKLKEDYDIKRLCDEADIRWLRGDDHQQHLINATVQQYGAMCSLRKLRSTAIGRVVKMVKAYWTKKADVEDKRRRAEERRIRNLAKWTGREVLKQWKLAADLVGHQKEEAVRKEHEMEGRKQLNAILEQSTQMLHTQRRALYEGDEPPLAHDGPTESENSELDDEDDGASVSDGSGTSAVPSEVSDADNSDEGSKDNDALMLMDEQQTGDDGESLIDDSGASLIDDSGESLIDDSDEAASSESDRNDDDAESDTSSANSAQDAPRAGSDHKNGNVELLEVPSKSDSSKWWAKFLVEDEIKDPPATMPGIVEIEGEDEAFEEDTALPSSRVATAPDAVLAEPKTSAEAANASVTSATQQRSRRRTAQASRTSTPSQDMVVRPKTRRSASRSSSIPTENDAELDEESESSRAAHRHDKPKVRIPFLLRGVLRPYQHVGLDWLASLYTNNVNGILADEMGLGKTIQTIALLAHLACQYGNWGPHLVVAPTSVMLNWEVEFKKFLPGFKILTYYGNQKERKEKRVGWALPNAFNVCITSYQLTLADAHVLKRRAWQYLILDEAHHIKNFRSQRWQTLLGFNSQRRLLLTGTPLQNNLLDLWSLMYFLMPNGLNQSMNGYEAFASLQDFQHWFSKPIDKAIEAGGTMNEEARDMVAKLHTVLRPYLLRRLKKDVEKELPSKHEHVITCRLSKRQRFLYNDFMSRAKTKESLATGSYLSIINCLMQLRKVCNHPDLFEERPIVTSFAMGRSVVADFEIEELFVRRRLLADETTALVDFSVMNGDVTAAEQLTPIVTRSTRKLAATTKLPYFDGEIPAALPVDTWSIDAFPKTQARKRLLRTMQRWKHFATLNAWRCARQPVFGASLIELLRSATKTLQPLDEVEHDRAAFLRRSDLTHAMIQSHAERKNRLDSILDRFAVVTPAATTSGVARLALPGIEPETLPEFRDSDFDTLHSVSTKLHIAFPDASLLQYDCGKLQQLDILMRRLKQGGHRILIFTQMTKMLDILESFLNYHGYRYLRLDGATKVDQRQLLTERFNRDPKIDAFILSTRSGGLGINLVGADTVLFYDLDWNAAIEAQCMDRAHRIGQTRDVHIYRFVSEHTVEENMLRKANQKRKLDSIVIQDGEFNTDTLIRNDWRDMFDEGGQTIAGVPVGRAADTLGADADRHLKAVEDEEDVQAAAVAEEEGALDRNDYEVMEEPAPGDHTKGGEGEAGEVDEDESSSIDTYMINFVTSEWDHFEVLFNK
ncbi:hypothetical protein V8E36_005927 [Tilletia maclaganii]